MVNPPYYKKEYVLIEINMGCLKTPLTDRSLPDSD